MLTKEALFPPELPRPRVAYSPAIKAGPFVFVSGQLASDLNTGTPAHATINPQFPFHGTEIELQVRYIGENIAVCLKAGGAGLGHVVHLTNYLVDPADQPGATRAIQGCFGGTPPPTSTIIVDELPIPGCRSEIDLVALVPDAGQRLEFLNPPALPAPLPAGLDGPPLHHLGVKCGSWLFTSGVLATDFAQGIAAEARTTDTFPYYGENGRLQAAYILERLKAVLAAGGASLHDVVKAEVYLTDLKDFFRLDEVWKEYFPIDPPARTTAPVRDLGIPGARIAINLIAFQPGPGQVRRTIHTDAAPTPLAHEPQAVQAGPLLFFSQQMATDYRTGVPPEAKLNPAFPYYGSESAAQVNYIVKPIEAICAAAGTSSEHLVRRRGFYTDFAEFFTSFATWGKAFPSAPPASTTIRVPAPLLVPGCKVAIDLIGLIPGAG
jgi:enamine deaminase RidA (YjgF/YER057c/UK114 family)